MNHRYRDKKVVSVFGKILKRAFTYEKTVVLGLKTTCKPMRLFQNQRLLE
jgi:hypothetical protein